MRTYHHKRRPTQTRVARLRRLARLRSRLQTAAAILVILAAALLAHWWGLW